ncbi:hypothetical protein EMIHUDRAFT_458246 [Emiliania huxleyi CCMP1516]|uniref:G domain-containing protein n=2 Tax=Emiliania huxleyi TaxID=2903 RepID=A0A0D3JER6_EMIH1|nr:hypothetical protein EMIHUDRAFT_458246 [Emiliania huxleyi CCMP1516]EOD22001.1 hypothetical protein EMIHUDRAFT_458246 [Emiliania huxleyi CCMP1516]|eukprot:XP_005774430.1 hypothetical protein EMIHUDRAFT_458246 [Emiliania huxleyi CCMP1516]
MAGSLALALASVSIALRRSPLQPVRPAAAAPLAHRLSTVVCATSGGKRRTSSAPGGITQKARERARARRVSTASHPAVGAAAARGASAAPAGSASAGPTRLADLPDFRGPGRLLKAARKAAATAPPSAVKGNVRKRAAKDAARKLEAFTSALSVPVKEQQRAFRAHLRALPPFEAALADLTLDSLVRRGGLPLSAVLQRHDEMRRAVEAIAVAANASSAAEASAALEEGLAEAALRRRGGGVARGRVESVFEAEAEGLMLLIETAQTLRRLPRVETDAPVAVLVGMPNVGKSSIVSATSSGTPEVNDYPFTTRGLKLGHVGQHGAPDRYQDERNAMEGLTLAAVQLLPSAVFVMDLSGTCGEQSAPRLQLMVREQIRAAFPRRPWLDVRSKADLPLAEGLAAEDVPPGTLDVSVHEGRNVAELAAHMAQMVSRVPGRKPGPPS